jgi:hypothetical protein
MQPPCRRWRQAVTGGDDDIAAALPRAPFPAPVRREAAIAEAMRRFDGGDPATAAAGGRSAAGPAPWRTRFNRPQAGALAGALLVALIALPLAWTSLPDEARDRPAEARDRGPAAAPAGDPVSPPPAADAAFDRRTEGSPMFGRGRRPANPSLARETRPPPMSRPAAAARSSSRDRGSRSRTRLPRFRSRRSAAKRSPSRALESGGRTWNRRSRSPRSAARSSSRLPKELGAGTGMPARSTTRSAT